MSLWVPVPRPAREIAAEACPSRVAGAHRGRVFPPRAPRAHRGSPRAEPSQHLRLTVHDLTDRSPRSWCRTYPAACR